MKKLPALWENPFRLMSSLDQMMGSLSDDFGFGTGYGKTDIYEKDGQIHYEIELPGMDKDNIAVRIEDDTLIIKGEVERDDTIERDNYLRMERRHGKFQKCFQLPAQVDDTENLKASFDKGVLKVSIPLQESLRGKTVDIPIE